MTDKLMMWKQRNVFSNTSESVRAPWCSLWSIWSSSVTPYRLKTEDSMNCFCSSPTYPGTNSNQYRIGDNCSMSMSFAQIHKVIFCAGS